MSLKKYFFTILLFLIWNTSFGQQGWELGGWIGGSNYWGDLNNNYRINRTGLAFGAIGRYNFNNRLCLKLGLNYGTVSGYDSDSKNTFEKTRNLSFKSNVFDVTGQFEFNFFPYNHGSNDEFYTPYIFGGITTYNYNPQAYYQGKWYNLREMGTEGQFYGDEYYSIAQALAYGVGFKIDLNSVWSMNFEASFRKLYNDYLDDVSSTYASRKDIEKLRGPVAVALADRSVEVVPDPIGTRGRQRGDSKSNDQYYFLSIGIVYYFGNLHCPTW
jgi:Domain of unknown function (DUF6089)